MSRCGSFPLLSAPHSLFSIWINLKRSEKIPGAPTWRWGERNWLTGPSGLHRNLPQGLNISSIRIFDQIRDPEIPITLRPLMVLNSSEKVTVMNLLTFHRRKDHIKNFRAKFYGTFQVYLYFSITSTKYLHVGPTYSITLYWVSKKYGTMLVTLL